MVYKGSEDAMTNYNSSNSYKHPPNVHNLSLAMSDIPSKKKSASKTRK
jgi:hypothetical protein